MVLDTALERLRLKVADTGIGIPKHAQASLLEPYVQAELSTLRRYGGSGLGLTIVKRIVSAMDGKISVQSVPGRGSTFTVFLPLKKTVAPRITATKRSSIKLPHLSIIVADDNAVNRMVLCRLLEEDGHSVVTMSNGKEVVEYLAKHDASVILMDLQMPVLDGISAVRKIRAMPGTRSTTPVIAATAHVIPQHRQEIMYAGMNCFLGKPFRKEELQEALQLSLAPNPSALARF